MVSPRWNSVKLVCPPFIPASSAAALSWAFNSYCRNHNRTYFARLFAPFLPNNACFFARFRLVCSFFVQICQDLFGFVRPLFAWFRASPLHTPSVQMGPTTLVTWVPQNRQEKLTPGVLRTPSVQQESTLPRLIGQTLALPGSARKHHRF